MQRARSEQALMRAPTTSVRFQPNDMVSLAPESDFYIDEDEI